MSDEDLRALERAVEAGGGPADRLRLAAALERLGRGWEALEALLPGRDDALVRERLGEFPCATRERQEWLGAPPPRVGVRVLWTRSGDRDQRLLAASPLGVVLGSGQERRLLVLDPDSGSVRWSCPWEQAGPASSPAGRLRPGDWPEVVGHVLLCCEPPALIGRDLWSGQVLWRTSLPAPRPWGLAAGEGRLLGWSQEAVWARRFARPGEPPGALLWSRALGPDVATWSVTTPCLRSGGGRVCLRVKGGWHVLEGESGRLLSRVPGEVLHVDAVGLVVRSEAGISALEEPDRPPVWSVADVWSELVTEQAVILEHHEGDALWHVAHGRRTGERLGLVVEAEEGHPLCAMDDLVLIERAWDRRTLEARTLRGEPVWDLRLPDPLHGLSLLVPLPPRRLLGLDEEGTWVCFRGA